MLFWFAVGIVLAHFIIKGNERERNRKYQKERSKTLKKESKRLEESFGRYISTCPKCGNVEIINCDNCDLRLFEKRSDLNDSLTCSNCYSGVSFTFCKCGCVIDPEFFEKINKPQMQKLVDYYCSSDKKLHNILTNILNYRNPRLSFLEFERIILVLSENPKDIKFIDFDNCDAKFFQEKCRTKIVNSVVSDILNKKNK